jgi:amidase
MMKPRTRRAFLRIAAASSAAPFVSRMGVGRASPAFDPDFGSAAEAARSIRLGGISSRELTSHVFRRIRAYDSKVNAFITLIEDEAMKRAAAADEALARGELWGALHGVPIVIKDSFKTAGARTTSGSLDLEDYIPSADAVAVSRLKRAGAVVIGKTNLPEFAGDWQSFNAIAGTTRNPWDGSRTPGGSTGGGAAALASGFGFLELGSDIGGSIRVPSHFCGIYGLKPTLNVIPMKGHIPPMPGETGAVSDLAVAGPMARAASDLRLGLETIGGPAPDEQPAYSWSLPPARRMRIQDYRIGWVLDDPVCPVSGESAPLLSGAVEALRKAGARLQEGWPDGFDLRFAYDAYRRLMLPYFPLGEGGWDYLKREKEGLIADYARVYLELETYPHSRWLEQTSLRLSQRALWQNYFKSLDAFLMPVAFVPAFSIQEEGDFLARTLQTPEGERPYLDMLAWATVPTLTGCPAVSAPAGRTSSGLPVGIQIMGPFLEDATPIDLAARMADLLGGFEAPEGFL